MHPVASDHGFLGSDLVRAPVLKMSSQQGSLEHVQQYERGRLLKWQYMAENLSTLSCIPRSNCSSNFELQNIPED